MDGLQHGVVCIFIILLYNKYVCIKYVLPLFKTIEMICNEYCCTASKSFFYTVSNMFLIVDIHTRKFVNKPQMMNLLIIVHLNFKCHMHSSMQFFDYAYL